MKILSHRYWLEILARPLGRLASLDIDFSEVNFKNAPQKSFHSPFRLSMRMLVMLAGVLVFETPHAQTKLDTLLAKPDTASTLALKSAYFKDLCYYYWAIDPDIAIEYGKKALSFAELSTDEERIASAQNVLGFSYSLKSNYVAATGHLLDALTRYEAIGKKLEAAKVANNLGTIYINQESYEKALKYIFEYYNYVQTDTTAELGIAPACANIGVVYQKLGQYDSALYYQNKYLELSEEAGDRLGVAIAKGNIGEVHYEEGKHIFALDAFQESYRISSELADTEGKIITLIGQGKVQIALSKAYKAVPLLEEALDLAKQYEFANYAKETYFQLGLAYEGVGKYKEALGYKKLYIALKDSLFNQDNTRQLNALQESYELTKKEAEIDHHQAEIALLNKQEEISRLIGIGLSIGLLLLGLLAFVLFRNNQVKQRINQALRDSQEKIEAQSNEIRAHNLELQQQQEEILAQRDAINEQNIKLESAFKEIAKQNENITASINYAQRIQTAMLPSSDFLSSKLKQFALLYKPRDIVSGDFYFCQEVNGHLIVAVADCTGHGVSGGFMSMIGNELLNEVVRIQGELRPDRILEYMDEGIRHTLQQEESKNRDGMDIACCTFMPDGKTLLYAGAKSPLLCIKDNEPVLVRGNRRSIGGFTQLKSKKKVENFQLHELDYTSIQSFYMFSDGYQDQFSSKTGKKIGVKRLSSFLSSLDKDNIAWEKRSEMIDAYLMEWTADERQIDDILVLGFSAN